MSRSVLPLIRCCFFAAILLPAFHEADSRPLPDDFLKYDLASLEEFVSKMDLSDVPSVQSMIGGSKCPVTALPFGALKSDWARLLLLEKMQPEGSVLKEKLPGLFRILIAAYHQREECLECYSSTNGSLPDSGSTEASSDGGTNYSGNGTTELSAVSSPENKRANTLENSVTPSEDNSVATTSLTINRNSYGTTVRSEVLSDRDRTSGTGDGEATTGRSFPVTEPVQRTEINIATEDNAESKDDRLSTTAFPERSETSSPIFEQTTRELSTNAGRAASNTDNTIDSSTDHNADNNIDSNVDRNTDINIDSSTDHNVDNDIASSTDGSTDSSTDSSIESITEGFVTEFFTISQATMNPEITANTVNIVTHIPTGKSSIPSAGSTEEESSRRATVTGAVDIPGTDEPSAGSSTVRPSSSESLPSGSRATERVDREWSSAGRTTESPGDIKTSVAPMDRGDDASSGPKSFTAETGTGTVTEAPSASTRGTQETRVSEFKHGSGHSTAVTPEASARPETTPETEEPVSGDATDKTDSETASSTEHRDTVATTGATTTASTIMSTIATDEYSTVAASSTSVRSEGNLESGAPVSSDASDGAEIERPSSTEAQDAAGTTAARIVTASALTEGRETTAREETGRTVAATRSDRRIDTTASRPAVTESVTLTTPGCPRVDASTETDAGKKTVANAAVMDSLKKFVKNYKPPPAKGNGFHVFEPKGAEDDPGTRNPGESHYGNRIKMKKPKILKQLPPENDFWKYFVISGNSPADALTTLKPISGRAQEANEISNGRPKSKKRGSWNTDAEKSFRWFYAPDRPGERPAR